MLGATLTILGEGTFGECYSVVDCWMAPVDIVS